MQYVLLFVLFVTLLNLIWDTHEDNYTCRSVEALSPVLLQFSVIKEASYAYYPQYHNSEKYEQEQTKPGKPRAWLAVGNTCYGEKSPHMKAQLEDQVK